jgi:hypothetical protein
VVEHARLTTTGTKITEQDQRGGDVTDRAEQLVLPRGMAPIDATT